MRQTLLEQSGGIIHFLEGLPFGILIGLCYMIVIHTKYTRELDLPI